MSISYFTTFAEYNAWANSRLYEACAKLSDDEYKRSRPCFFGSIHATLNHLMIVDRLFMGRVDGAPPRNIILDEILYDEFTSLRDARAIEDQRLIDMVASRGEEDLDNPVSYVAVINDRVQHTPRRLLLASLFNHQTHHRGQVHCLLSQTDVRPPAMDLIYFLWELGERR